MLLFLSLFSAAGCYGGGDDESNVSEVGPKAVVTPSGTAVKQPIDSPKQNSDAPASGQAKKPAVYSSRTGPRRKARSFTTRARARRSSPTTGS